ncbi:hypothetical protein C8Q76DRAFT_252456 [Earliella scabrosa]|nr:hypothetical protein C8Q76DRAFT_252456 [Earliella scabrosa]
MIFKDGKPSPFYKSYVRDIQRIITENAANEFGCIWREHARVQGAKPRTQGIMRTVTKQARGASGRELPDLQQERPEDEGSALLPPSTGLPP